MTVDPALVTAIAALIIAAGNSAAVVLHAMAAMQRPRSSQHTVNGGPPK